MRRTMVLVAFLALLAVAALALTASAQTNPPASGDWTITDSTTFTNQQITINNGDVMINGNGHLSLTNVNLRFTGAGTYQIRVSTNARLTISGGTISSQGGYYSVVIDGGVSSIDGCTLTQTNGVTINTWKAKFTNNTVTASAGNGVSVAPSDSYSRPVDISDNHIMNSSGDGISINVGDYGSSDVWVICHGNNVSGSLRNGIVATANTDKGRFLFRANELYRNAIDGLNANLQVRVIEFRIDDIRAHNNSDDGVSVRTYSSTMLAKYIYRVTSIGNGNQGVYITFDNQHWDRPVFRNWYIWDNEGGGIWFQNFNCATLENSYNVNDRSQADYSMVNTNLEVYRTTHRKGMARVSGGAYSVTSYRSLELSATWQNGIACHYSTVEFEGPGGNRLFVYQTDFEGYMGNNTEWDWSVRETTSSLRHSFTPYLVGGTQRLAGTSIDFDRDLKMDLVFFDIQTPDLTVDSPSTNHVQNTDNLSIVGTCLDAHSGARVVQVSFDPEPNWNLKTWENATGTSPWHLYKEIPDAVLTIFVRAYDWASYPNGVYANITITNVTVDTSAPNLTIIQPFPDTITNQSQLTVLGTTDPDVVSLTLNGEPLSAFGGTFNKPIQLNEGINNIVIIATDYAGNIANANRTLTLDSIAPIVVVRAPPQDYYTNVNSVTLGGVSDREGATMTVDGSPTVIKDDGTWSHTVGPLAKGWNQITIDAVDKAKNHRVVTHRVYYDPDPPKITVTKPEAESIVNSSVFNLLGYTDTDVLNSQIRVNGIWIGLDNYAFDSEFTLLEEGPAELVFYAKDRAGNENSVTVPIFIDTTPPPVKDLLPIDGEIVNEFIINVTGTTDPDAQVFVNGRFAELDDDGNFREQINLEVGDNAVTVRATDTAGNTRILSRIITLDTTPPEVFVDGLTTESLKTDTGHLTITGNTEPTSELIIEFGKLDDPAPPTKEAIPVDENGEFSYSVVVGKNKTTSVLLHSTDYAGNTNTVAFLIKREIPEEPSFTEEHPEVLYGIVIVVVALLVAYPLTRMSMDRTYDRRLKVMGYGTQQMPQPGQAPPPPPPGQRPPGPPGRGPPGQAPPPQGAPKRRPPRPPSDGPRAPPRPPTEEEGGAAPAPRPPRDDE